MKHAELKKLAEAANRSCTLNNKPIFWFKESELLNDATIDHTDDAKFIAAASPDVILGLLAEIEQLEFELRVEHSREHGE